ncbi:multicopper oxidase [Legionella birminghamensis]|uniref:Multicopper oxidase n=1 Tax=Legionella birminghamensis TaxID=28083 RepID=A0A378JR33_9GAMM|nr:multicopper oxidase domain-containing protein [Legionella birminghamensis]KTC69025.1 multicopper oxidase [Legionella birminghamensis]STX60993.1 multicopper oxidase [Legionella birminghamensis]
MNKGCLRLFLMICAANVWAKHHIIDLTVAYDTFNFTGYPARAIAVNHQIPAPTLRFKEGDEVTINVHNHLDKEAAIHWHGIILPWQMDGVMNITQRGIPPGATFQYHYTLHQSGTYWYHSHAGLQEQEGLYGAYIIEPKSPPPFKYNKDFEVVLSDWKNTKADHIQANLKKTGEYYGVRFPLQPSLLHFIQTYSQASKEERKKLLMDYKMMQYMRMGIFDLSDIAYDTFLMNGHPTSRPWTRQVKVGDVVRLRFVGAGANTFFRVKIPGATMKMVHVQGNDVVPYPVKDFFIGPGETNDILVKIEQNKPYIIYAQSFDKVGKALGALITNASQPVLYAEVKPFPDPKPTTRGKMKNEKKRDLKPMAHMGMQSELHHQPRINTIVAANLLTGSHEQTKHHHKQKNTVTIGTKYQNLKAKYETNDPRKPIYKTINLQLFGFMDRFIWFINGVPEYNAKPIKLLPAKRYRLVFINNSMMHHPMHLHGHWLILRNGHGNHDPLLHTIDIPPGSEVTADLDTDASGQWFFHCHMLNHMASGLARTFQYSSIIEIAKGKEQPKNIIKHTSYYNRPIVRVDELRPISLPMVEHPVHTHNKFFAASFIEFGGDFSKNRQTLTYYGLYGPDFNKLQLYINDAEMEKGNISNADIDIFYWRQISQFWMIKGGANYFYRPSKTPYWQPGIGFEGLMYYFITNNSRFYYHKESIKADIEFGRNTQLTNNLFLGTLFRAIAATKTIPEDEISKGLNETQYVIRPNYRLTPGISAFMEYEYTKYHSILRNIRRRNGEPVAENSLFFGLNFII